ncbi:sodium:solute symporter family protein [Natribacillus halophilus]|uniref:Sodium:solute symporter family protein n=1 Tax=Natribacillus halophilus TaxID=549003 RepID=A0A1G8R9G8_9BACI|nr:sodium:solute symporter family protein [Natribacillus halophilus]SDJ13569.1 Sodium:solute symporter family protein [Natribacillus halophilus]
MQVTETIIIVIYLIVVILMGIYFSRRALSTEDDYWAAGRRINSFVGAFALFAALASASSLMGAVGSGVEFGLPFFFAYGFGAIGILPLLLFVAAGQLRRSGVRTLPEYFSKRYGQSVQIIAAVIVVISMTFYMVPQLTASGLIGQYVLGIEYTTAVILIGASFILYAAIGGMWAITYTDLVQGMLIVVGLFVLAVVIFIDHGGFGSLVQSALAVDPDFGSVQLGWMSYFGIFISFLFFGIVSPSAVMRNFTSTSAKIARRTALGACFLYLLVFVFGLFIAIAGVNLDILGTVDNTDMIFIAVIEHYLPSILAGIMLAGLIAAIMSSADAMLLAVSAGVAQDIYKGAINKRAKEKTVTIIGLICMLIAGFIGLLIALEPPQLIAIMVGWVGGALLSTFAFPVILGIWWSRANTPGAIAGILGGGITFLVLVTTPGELVSEPIIAAPVSLMLMIVVSLLTKSPSENIKKQVELNYTRIKDDM